MKTWTTHEHAKFVQMLSDGFSHREIGNALGRSRHAICSRAQNRKRIFDRVAAPPAEYPMVRIAPADVAAWYAKGWRFGEFVGAECQMFWPHEKFAEVRP